MRGPYPASPTPTHRIIAESLSPSYLAYERIKALHAAAEGQNNTIIDVEGNVSPIVGGLR